MNYYFQTHEILFPLKLRLNQYYNLIFINMIVYNYIYIGHILSKYSYNIALFVEKSSGQQLKSDWRKNNTSKNTPIFKQICTETQTVTSPSVI